MSARSLYNTLTIRPARPEDAETIAALSDEAQRLYATLLPHFFNTMDREYWRSRFVRSLALRDYFIVVAETTTGTPPAVSCVGYIELFIKRTTSPLIRPQSRLLIDNLVVHPAFRRSGVGRRLLAAADDFAAAHGIDIVELQVASDNEAALHLYRSAGYTARSCTMEKRLHR